MKHVLICFAVCLFIVNASAQEEEEHIETDRPSETETPRTVKAKYFQVETGVLFEKTSASNRAFSHPTSLLKYGLQKNLELRLQVNYSTLREQYMLSHQITRGIEPVTAGVKLALWEEAGWIPTTALIVQTGIPMLASKGFKEDYLSPELRVAFKNTLIKRVSISYNAGVEREGNEKVGTWMYSFTPEVDISKHFFIFAEAFGFFKKGEAAQHSIDGGIEYFINNDFVLDLMSGAGISKTAPRFFVTLGGSIRFR